MSNQVRHAASSVSLALVLLSVAGCATPAAAPSTPSSSTAPQSESPAKTHQDVSDAKTCEAFSDVLTVVHNATVARNQARMTEQEYDKWLQLATRLLAEVPVRSEGDVSEDVRALQAKAPAIPTDSAEPTQIGGDSWMQGVDISTHCDEAGSPVAVDGFVGG